MALEREATRDAAFDLVFNAHRDHVYNLANMLLRNTQDAEDVTQEVFLRVYKALPTYDAGRAGMRTWLTRFTVNACQTHRRRNFLHRLLQRFEPESEDTPDPVDFSPLAAPEAHAVQSEMRHTVKEVLDTLRIEHRTVLVLHYYLDLSCAEIASMMGCPEGTIYSRLYHARRLVQARLERTSLHVANEVEI
jgi:RNA polymerase sigma-70 factor, ECF subfamily